MQSIPTVLVLHVELIRSRPSIGWRSTCSSAHHCIAYTVGLHSIALRVYHCIKPNKQTKPPILWHSTLSLAYDLSTKLVSTNSYEIPKIQSLVLWQFSRSSKTSCWFTSSSVSKPSSQAVGSEDMASLNQSSTQVRQALLLLSNQLPQEATYRVARPSLGIRAEKLASYQVTLHGSTMMSFLTRISQLLQEQASQQRRSSSSTSSMTGDPLQTTTRQARQPIAGVRKSSTPFWNDGSKTEEGLNRSFDGQGNFITGFLVSTSSEKLSKILPSIV